jgi:hypothetical protein
LGTGTCWICLADPWSGANPIRLGAEHDPGGLGTTLVEEFDPAFQAVHGFATGNYVEGVVGVFSTALVAVGGAEVVGDLAGLEIVDAADAADGDIPASTPTGVRGSPMDVPPGTNSPTMIDDISYSGHAIDEMQSEGFVPSVIQDAIENGQEAIGSSGRVAYYSPENNISVITENGRVITVSSGFLKVR